MIDRRLSPLKSTPLVPKHCWRIIGKHDHLSSVDSLQFNVLVNSTRHADLQGIHPVIQATFSSGFQVAK
ncbi:hypothetical protein KIN20_018353 [Parelaphostrongylus tenuis]|uniref:Uncharacterized protein n=1 Tax=Parelaphostrongylus tenuis TaxID=148309 RepID=A0AAD5MMW8_PARTN|nr:hypothetical protein KIN20_018353 [Parelaphostrongylus tenuis]